MPIRAHDRPSSQSNRLIGPSTGSLEGLQPIRADPPKPAMPDHFAELDAHNSLPELEAVIANA